MKTLRSATAARAPLRQGRTAAPGAWGLSVPRKPGPGPRSGPRRPPTGKRPLGCLFQELLGGPSDISPLISSEFFLPLLSWKQHEIKANNRLGKSETSMRWFTCGHRERDVSGPAPTLFPAVRLLFVYGHTLWGCVWFRMPVALLETLRDIKEGETAS